MASGRAGSEARSRQRAGSDDQHNRPVANLTASPHANGASPSGSRRGASASVLPLRLGMRFKRNLPFEQWVLIGRSAAMRADASLWWLGDWLLYGAHTYGGRYKQGIELTGLDYQTLRNYATVARRFEISRRRERLSFHHHAELCPLPPEQQDTWLDRAEAGGWSRNELRRRLRTERQLDRPPGPTRVAVMVDAERQARWRQAAEASGRGLTPWIVETLDSAARALIDEPPN